MWINNGKGTCDDNELHDADILRNLVMIKSLKTRIPEGTLY